MPHASPLKTLLIATQNSGKLMAFQKAFAHENLNIRALCEFTKIEPDENGTTFEENALIKARFAHAQTGLPSLSDDSGLCIDCLDGAPGVYSANLAMEEGGKRNYVKAFLTLQERMGSRNTTARFVGVLAYVDDVQEKLFRAETVGRIDFFSFDHCDTQTFAYDPIFIPEGDTRTFATMGAEAKVQYSPRSKAILLFKAWLRGEAVEE